MPDDMRDDTMDDLIARVVEELRRPVAVSPEFDARLMAQLYSAPHSRLGGVAPIWTWLRRPRTLRLSPLGALGLAAAAALVVVLARALAVALGASSQTVARTPVTEQLAPVVSMAEHGGTQMVRFVFLAPNAHTVAVAGDFNNWSVGHTMMRRVSPSGLWTVDVPLRPGRYTYTFVVDGTRWLADPAAPREIGDDFGAPSSVLAVIARGST